MFEVLGHELLEIPIALEVGLQVRNLLVDSEDVQQFREADHHFSSRLLCLRLNVDVRNRFQPGEKLLINEVGLVQHLKQNLNRLLYVFLLHNVQDNEQDLEHLRFGNGHDGHWWLDQS